MPPAFLSACPLSASLLLLSPSSSSLFKQKAKKEKGAFNASPPFPVQVPFTVPIDARMALDTDALGYFTTWGRGCIANNGPTPPALCASTGPWQNPLAAAAFPGPGEAALGFRLGSQSKDAQPPANDSMTVPMVTVLSGAAEGLGLTLVLNLRENVSETVLAVDHGGVALSRQLLRLQPGSRRNVSLSALLLAHEPDWRAGLNRTLRAFPTFFAPAHPNASDYEGLAGYSWNKGVFNATRAHRLGYRTNWDLSGTWMAYQGLFLGYTPEWLNLGPVAEGIDQYNVSAATIAAAYRRAKAAGFRSLSYFNLADWGVSIELNGTAGGAGVAGGAATDGAAAPLALLDQDRSAARLRNASCGVRPGGAVAPCPTPQGSLDYLLDELRPAILHNGWSMLRGPFQHYIPDWVKCVVLDAGDRDLNALQMEQLQRHFDLLHDDFEGIVIDRLDFSDYYNQDFDDGVSWVPRSDKQPGYAPARALRLAYRRMFDSIGSLLHRGGGGAPRLLLINCNALCRVDLFEGADGTFSEGSHLNGVSWSGLAAPSIMWTYKLAGSTDGQLDAFFQQHLLMDTFPMAPMPKNDHSILPNNATIEAAYFMYAPLFDAMVGARWLLLPSALALSPASAGEALPLWNIFTREQHGDVLVVLALDAAAPSAQITVTLGASVRARLRHDFQAAALRTSDGGEWKALPLQDGAVRVTLERGVALLRFF